MVNRMGHRVTAGVLALVVSSAVGVTAEPLKPTPQPQAIRQWKLDDISRARWKGREASRSSKVPQAVNPKKKSNRALPVILIGIGGAIAGGLFGSAVQGSLCECDDQRIVGATYGALLGGAGAGIIAYTALR